MADILMASPEEAARSVTLRLLGKAQSAAEDLQDLDNPEALHDFRVSIRRLRSVLRAFKRELSDSISKKDRRAFRDLIADTGAGRDAEVAIEWLEEVGPRIKSDQRPGFYRVVQDFRKRIEELSPDTRRKLRKRFNRLDEEVAPNLESVTLPVNPNPRSPRPTFAGVIAPQILDHLDSLVDRMSNIESARDPEPAHMARIEVKRLRYLLETVSGAVPDVKARLASLKKLQDVLGLLHDGHVLTEHLDAVERITEAEKPGFKAVRRRNDGRIRTLFASLTEDWLGDGMANFADEVRKVVETIRGDGGLPREIERKFLLKGLPEQAHAGQVKDIVQGWLPGKELRERIRRVRSGDENRYYRTIKLGAGIERIELEEETTEAMFDALWPLTEGCRVRKRRYVVRDDGFVWELDEFLDRELFLAEVELDDAATVPAIPDWLDPHMVEEVTENPDFTNLRLAR